MPKKLEEVLKKIPFGNLEKGQNPETDGSAVPKPKTDLPGDPDCEVCKGMGYYRLEVPVGHPDFGKLQVCQCRQRQINLSNQDRLFSMSNLDQLSHLTFENFEPRGRIGLAALQADSLERAFNHSQQFAENRDGWLLLIGRYGCGKTHLAAAIANKAVSLGIPTLFITVPDMLDNLRYSYQDKEYNFEQRFEEIRRIKLLILDDFGTQNATSWAQEKLFQIINFRYVNKLPLVVTTNLTLSEIEGRIQSRLQDPDLVTRVRIHAPDYRNPAADTGYHRLSSLGMLTNRAFGNFSLRERENIPPEGKTHLRKAFEASQRFAEKPDGWLVLSGGYGSGKTHLAAAIHNYLASEGYAPLFVSVPDLMDHLKSTFSPRSDTSYDRLFDEVRTAQVLILDDLGSQSMTPWVKEKLYQLFNYRYNAELPTVITTAVEKSKDLDPRIESRFMDQRLCDVHRFDVPAYRGTAHQR